MSWILASSNMVKPDTVTTPTNRTLKYWLKRSLQSITLNAIASAFALLIVKRVTEKAISAARSTHGLVKLHSQQKWQFISSVMVETVVCTFIWFSSTVSTFQKGPTQVAEPYRSVLTSYGLLGHHLSDFKQDNEAIYDICRGPLNVFRAAHSSCSPELSTYRNLSQ